MFYITGDTHGDFSKLRPAYFEEGTTLTRADYVIICGDFGGVWNGGEHDRIRLNQLEQLPFTVLFVSGNHENFEQLATYPITEWNGGKVQFIRPNVIHLLRGQVFDIDGKTFFAMGGARSHDIQDGILEPDAPDFEERFWNMRRMRMMFRVNHLSWWKEELPSEEEYEEARQNLRRAGFKVDYVISHCAPNHILDILGGGLFEKDALSDFFEEIRTSVDFKRWYFGHFHLDRNVGQKFTVLYDEIIPLENE